MTGIFALWVVFQWLAAAWGAVAAVGHTIWLAILSLQHAHPYAGLFLVVTLETCLILHFVPATGWIIVTAARPGITLAGYAWIVVVATAAATLGSWILYVASRYGGRDFIVRHPRWFGLTTQRLRALDDVFGRPTGEFMVFAFRLAPFMRALITIPAGLARMPVRRFLVLTALGHFALNLGLVMATALLCQHAGCTRAALTARGLYWGRASRGFVAGHWILVLVTLALVVLLAWLAWANRRGLVREYDHLLVKAWERTAVASAAVGLMLLGAALLFPELVIDSQNLISSRVRSALHPERDPVLSILLWGASLFALGLGLLALRYTLAGPVRRWRKKRSDGPPP
ncbi:MAG: DedA family protein [Thermoplasmatota archaeon]